MGERCAGRDIDQTEKLAENRQSSIVLTSAVDYPALAADHETLRTIKQQITYSFNRQSTVHLKQVAAAICTTVITSAIWAPHNSLSFIKNVLRDILFSFKSDLFTDITVVTECTLYSSFFPFPGQAGMSKLYVRRFYLRYKRCNEA